MPLATSVVATGTLLGARCCPWGDFIPSWRLQGRFVLKMLTLLRPPISLQGLKDSTNKPAPSPPLAGTFLHSWCFCSRDFPGKRMKEQRVLSPLPSLQQVASPSWPCWSTGRSDGSKHRARILQIPGPSAWNTNMSTQLCSITTDQVCHPKLLSTLQKKNSPKSHDRALLQQIINHYIDPFQAAVFLFCGEKVFCQYNCLKTCGNACFIT